MAREAGLRLTAHAGEWGGPESVRDALDDLRVSRIGHGVRAIEDPALVDRLAEDGVVLEVCPGSNIALGLYPVVATGIRSGSCTRRVSRSRSRPTIRRSSAPRSAANTTASPTPSTGTTRSFGARTRTAAAAAFCDAATRDALLKRLEPEDA